MHQKKKDVLTAVKEGCRTTLQVSVATDIDREYCAKLLSELAAEGYIELYEKIKYGVADGGNKYRPLDTRYAKRERAKEGLPPMDPLMAAFFGKTSSE